MRLPTGAQAILIGREVVVRRVLVIAILTAALHLVVSLHWVTVAQSEDAIQKITSALDGLGVLVATLYARRGVTPNSDPRTSDGSPLVPISDPVLGATPLPPDDVMAVLAQAEAIHPANPDSPAAHVPGHAAVGEDLEG